MTDLDTEVEALTQQLSDHYRHEFSHTTLPTITVSQAEVDILTGCDPDVCKGETGTLHTHRPVFLRLQKLGAHPILTSALASLHKNSYTIFTTNL